MPYSWKLSTTISNNEASESYKEVNDPAVMVAPASAFWGIPKKDVAPLAEL